MGPWISSCHWLSLIKTKIGEKLMNRLGLLVVTALACASASALAQTPPPAPTGPAPLQVQNPTYISIPMEIEVNKPAAEVWKRIGKFCDIGEWLQIGAGCHMLSGKEGEIGGVRSVGNEILV